MWRLVVKPEKSTILPHLWRKEKAEVQYNFLFYASMYAYAAAAFFQVQTSEYVKMQLLSAKARDSPTGKKTTIARLELLAATITASLASSIKRDPA
ncbi:hypothetical protein HNY73_008088 [Argiope bruennichi]|uniref:Uncharacterized protein n=1 Tax=Argiope bruennichi TaxID=94029 RepID=A0A8T0F5H5_ARGBR|nr:hypothetical protein HNY73_008088 [Argiope bruennichi]